MTQDSLSSRINNKESLSQSDIDQLMEIFGARCHAQTKRMLRRVFSWVPDIDNHGIYERIHFDAKYGWSYCAGQDYRAELPRIRKLLLGR